MSKFKSGVSGSSRKSTTSRRPIVPGEPTAHCSTSRFQPDLTYGDCDESSRFIPGSMAGMSPSSRGHTMKECEEQLSQLNKENFNLKLRIYFLEERLGHRGPGAPPWKEAACEATLRAEAESLRGELADKQRLLVQAATAIDLVEKKHREEVEGAAADRAALEERLEHLHKMYSERCQQLEDEMARVSAPQGGQPVETTSVGTQCDVDPSGAEEKVDRLGRQLEARGRQVAEAEQRIRGLEEALSEKQPEIQIKVQELRERDNIIEEKQNQLEQQNRVLVEIQITLAEKQRLIDALNATISARDVSVARLGAELEAANRELGRTRGENEMLKTQLGRRMARGESRESPRRRGGGGGGRAQSPRNKTLIEEAIEGIWSAPVLRSKDEFLPFEEKENLCKVNDSKEKPDRPQPIVDHERRLSERFSEENYLRLEKEHQRGCEAIQGFIARIKHLTNENEAARRESRRSEKKLSELRLELKELRDSYNRAEWEARQLRADATGVPGSLADVRDMTEEENERLWAEVEDKNKKFAQLSLDMEKQIQALLTSLKEKEAQLTACETRLATSEGDLSARERYVKELEEKLSQLPSNVITNNSATFDLRTNGLSRNVIDDLGACLRQSMMELKDSKLWNKESFQDSLDVIFKKRETETFSLQHQVEFKELQLRLFGDEPGVNRTMVSPTNECVPVNFVQNLQLEQSEIPAIEGSRWSKEEQVFAGSEGHNKEFEALREELRTSETARKNATNACALLVGRLEELAGFLVSLLSRPDRLGDLDRRFIRQAVQRSVDLSRQLSASVSHADSSLRYLEDTLDDVEGRPTTLDESTRVIARLRSQVETLGLELRQRDIELNCLKRERDLVRLSSPLFDVANEDRPLSSMAFYGPTGFQSGANELEMCGMDIDNSTDHARLPEPSHDVLVNSQPIGASKHDRGNTEAPALSESETWSEPDRQISLARIGLDEPARRHHSRPLPQEQEESSGSSQETARETVRTPGKQRRGDALESRRLQARLRGLEQVNEALRTELAILHQVTPIAQTSLHPESPVERETSSGKTIETDSGLDNPVVVPSHLLEQIRHQREKLESSLFHNDFIRRQLEGVFLSASGPKADQDRTALMRIEAAPDGDTIRSAEAKLRVAEEKVTELDGKLREAEGLIAEGKEQATRLVEAEKRCEETRRAISALEEKVGELEAMIREKDAEISKKDGLFGEMEERASKQKAEIDRTVREMAEMKMESERRVTQAEERLSEAKSVLLLELKEAKQNLNEALMQRAEANEIIDTMKSEFSAKVRAFEETQRGLELRLDRADEENTREMDRRSRKLEEAERQLKELRWAHKAEVDRRVEAAESSLRRRVEVAESRFEATRRERDEVSLAASRAALDGSRLANEKLRLEQELRGVEAELTRERIEARLREGEVEAKTRELESRARELEAVNAELRAQLERMSASRGATSPPPPPTSQQPHHRADNRDNGYASGRGWNPDNRPRSPDSGRSPLSSMVLQHGFGRQHSEFSDYVSEDQEFETVVTRSCSSSYWITTVMGGGGRGAQSPDLGIESDQGRFSSLEANVEEKKRPDAANDTTVQTFRRGHRHHNCSAIEEKNLELQRELCQTRRALQDTLAQLTAANHRKQNVEKAICKQIEKTCSILMETKGNLQPDERLMLCNDRT